MTILLRQKPLPQVVRQIFQRDNGAWFDPEDMSTMYQDASGTTPVTALEQPVGLWLDKSRGLELEPELVTNGAFNTDLSGWTQGTNVTTTQINGAASMARNGTVNADLAFRQTIALTLGKTYKLIFNASVSSCAVKVSNSSLSVGPIVAGTGTLSYIFTATSNTAIINFWPTNNLTTTVIDNISVREIKGNHATQSITASRPTLSARYNQLLNSATLSTQSVTTVAAQYTLSFTGTGSVTLSGTATGTLAGTGANNRVSLSFTPTAGTLTLTVTGSVTLAMLALGTLTTYQAITTATSYDNVGWSCYVRFDGIDDYLNLPYMGLYANGSASVILPMSSSDVASVYSRIIAETSTVNANARYIIPREDLNTTGTDISINADDTTTILSSVVVPFSKEVINIRSYVDNGSLVKTYSDSSEKQTVAYSRAGKTLTLNSTLFGAQATPTVVNAFASIKSYGLIITKSALSDTDRRRCEQFLASRLSQLGVTLS